MAPVAPPLEVPRFSGMVARTSERLAGVLLLLLVAVGCGGPSSASSPKASATQATPVVSALAPSPTPTPTVQIAGLCSLFSAAQLTVFMGTAPGPATEEGDGVSHKSCNWLAIGNGDIFTLTVSVSTFPDAAGAQAEYAKERAATDAGRGAAPSVDVKLDQPTDAAYLSSFAIPGADALATIGGLKGTWVYQVSLQAHGGVAQVTSNAKAAFSIAYAATV